MIDRSATKKEAKALLRSTEPSAFKASLLVTVATFVVTLPYLVITLTGGDEASFIAFFLDILSALLGWVLSAGLINFLLAVHRHQGADYRNIWDCFGIAGKIIWLQIRINIQVALWSMLFVIPGIIASFRYSFALYCLLDDPNLTAGQAIRRSCEKTEGWKMELFMLELSFIGLTLLCICVPAVASALIGVVALPVIGETGLIMLVLALLAAPVAWLQAYMSLAQIGYYRAAVPDSPAETTGFTDGDAPWEF